MPWNIKNINGECWRSDLSDLVCHLVCEKVSRIMNDGKTSEGIFLPLQVIGWWLWSGHHQNWSTCYFRPLTLVNTDECDMAVQGGVVLRYTIENIWRAGCAWADFKRWRIWGKSGTMGKLLWLDLGLSRLSWLDLLEVQERKEQEVVRRSVELLTVPAWHIISYPVAAGWTWRTLGPGCSSPLALLLLSGMFKYLK